MGLEAKLNGANRMFAENMMQQGPMWHPMPEQQQVCPCAAGSNSCDVWVAHALTPEHLPSMPGSAATASYSAVPGISDSLTGAAWVLCLANQQAGISVRPGCAHACGVDTDTSYHTHSPAAQLSSSHSRGSGSKLLPSPVASRMLTHCRIWSGPVAALPLFPPSPGLTAYALLHAGQGQCLPAS